MSVAFRPCGASLALVAVLAGCDMAPSSAPSQAAAATPAAAAAQGKCDTVPDHAYDLPAARVDETAQRLAHANGRGNLYDAPPLSPLLANAAIGRVGIRQAIQHAIDGTALQLGQDSADTIAVGHR
jgi:hypothetical protein